MLYEVITELDTYRLKKLVKEEFNAYGNVVDADFRTFRFFISAQTPVDITVLEIPGTYRYTTMTDSVDWEELLRNGALLLLILLVTFRYLFKNYIVV